MILHLRIQVHVLLWSLAIVLNIPVTAQEFPLRVSHDGRYLVDSTDSPFLFIGDTHWPLLWHYTFEDVKAIVEDRKQKGFTAIFLSVAAFSNRENAYGNPTFVERQTLTVSEEYFEHADRVLRYLYEEDMAVYAVALWWNQYRRDGDPASLKEYGRFLGARWKDLPNVIWAIGGDMPFRSIDVESYEALAWGIRESGAAQLMTWHPNGGRPFDSPGHSSAEYFREAGWHQFSSMQGHHTGSRMARRLLEDYNRIPVQPVILMEPWYDWHETRDPVFGFPIHQRARNIRISAYQTTIGGGSFGVGYGAWPLWYHESSEEQWRAALSDRPSTIQIATYMRQFLEDLPWWTIKPDQEGKIWSKGRGEADSWGFGVSAFGEDQSLLLVYVPSHRSFELVEDHLPRDFSAVWFDPTDGSYTEAAFDHADGLVRFSSPKVNSVGDSDFVLVLRQKK